MYKYYAKRNRRFFAPESGEPSAAPACRLRSCFASLLAKYSRRLAACKPDAVSPPLPAVRELAPTEKVAPDEVAFVKVEGLGRLPFSNIRRWGGECE